MTEDFTPKYDNYAVYLPSLQKGYAQFAAKNQRLLDKGTVPANLNIKDLNYLSTDSTLWQCRYALYSAGQFNGSIIEQADMVRDRNKENTVVVGDSGGYQIATGKLNALNGWDDYKNKPKVIFDKWMAEPSVRDRLVRWLDCYCDYAVTIDMPLWITTKRNGIFAKLDAKQLIDLSVENLKFVAKRRGAATGAKAKYLNVLHDVGNGSGDAWYDAVKDFDFEGWSFGSDTGKDVDAILHWLRRLLDDHKLDKAEWLHILQASPPKNAVVLTHIQKRLRELLGSNIRISYDSSSPFMHAGKYGAIAKVPTLTKDISTWKIGVEEFPQSHKYVGADNIEYLSDFPSPVTGRFSINDFHTKNDVEFGQTFLSEASVQLLVNHNLYVYHKTAINACDMYERGDELPKSIADDLKKVDAMLR